MWIDRKTYDEIRLDASQVRGENVILNQQYTALITTLDWLRVRVTQLEMERAQLILNYTGVQVPHPVITRKADANPMNQLPNFNGLNDEEAAALGVGWNADGTLSYSKVTNG